MIKKIKGEHNKAYQALLDYWNLGAARSLGMLQEKYEALENAPTKSYSTIAQWSSKYRWADRIADEIFEIAQENESIAKEERQKLFRKQFELIYNVLGIEELSRANIDYEKMSLAQYNALIGNIWKMLADLRTNDTQKIALTDPSGEKEYTQIDHSNVNEILERLRRRQQNEQS